jgi:hypothetical protein
LSGGFPRAIVRVLQALADLLAQIVQHNTTTALMGLYRPTANFVPLRELWKAKSSLRCSNRPPVGEAIALFPRRSTPQKLRQLGDIRRDPIYRIRERVRGR